jgi:hypothetical protein
MPYAAVITSADHAPNLLEDIAPSFASAIATIRRRENEWIMESSSFEPYESDQKLYEAANNLVSQIHRLLTLYLGRHGEPLSVRALLKLTDDDKLIGRRRYFTQTFDIVRPARQVLIPTASGSFGTDVLARAATDPAITEALSLVGYEAPTWGQIYDIIEFLGGPPAAEFPVQTSHNSILENRCRCSLSRQPSGEISARSRLKAGLARCDYRGMRPLMPSLGPDKI